MNRLWLGLFLFCVLFSGHAPAQLWGGTPFQNGPDVDQGGLYLFDPDSLTWLDGRAVTLPNASVNGIMAITIHPKDPEGTPPEQRRAGTAYAILKVFGVSAHVLATVDLQTGIATQIGNLGDKFATLSFREDGQLFGVTSDDAQAPEMLYLLDKFNGSKTFAGALGIGTDGEVIAYHPDDDLFYHWSGEPFVVYEKIQSSLPYLTTNIPIVGTPTSQVFGAVWDPCRKRDFGGKQALAFIGTNYNVSPTANNSFNAWRSTGQVSAPTQLTPDGVRGLALVGGYTCEVDVGIGAGSPNPDPAPHSAISILLVIDNDGPARAMEPVITITVPSSVSAVTTSGCLEDPNGVPTCTPRIVTQRYQMLPQPGYTDFALSSLWTGRATTVTVNGTYDGTGGMLNATVTTGSQEIRDSDNTVQYRLGNVLFSNSFE